MSGTDRPTWWHPLLRMHHRRVEKHVVGAEKAAVDLGIDFDASKMRYALAFRRWALLRRLLPVLVVLGALGVFAALTYPGACRPGGLLTSDETWCGSFSAYILGPDGDPWSATVAIVVVVCFALTHSAWAGENVARCYEPMYALLDLLSASAALAMTSDSQYTDAARLNRRAAELGLPLRKVARDAASAFGRRRLLRKKLLVHASKVEATLMQAADDLVEDREDAARRLGTLAGIIATNIADGRFTTMLPEAELAESSTEPDRLDGRRLAKAGLVATVSVTAFSLVLGRLGVPAELLLPLAALLLFVMIYMLLAFWYGLAEATRLTRSVRSFHTGPQL